LIPKTATTKSALDNIALQITKGNRLHVMCDGVEEFGRGAHLMGGIACKFVIQPWGISTGIR
jgi:phosphotransferase system HPr-like phosphotransfer protein